MGTRGALLAGAVASMGPVLAGSAASAERIVHHTPPATSVMVAGSLQSELGCSGDWDPGCTASALTYDGDDLAWQGTFDLPVGNWEYKAAVNGTWDENYGLHAQPNGANIPLALGTAGTVKFYYHEATHWVTDNVSSRIVVAPGSFQSELGCAGDWDPTCLRSWLQDPDGDGTATFTTDALPAGSYEAKAAIDESWDENYGAGGAANGANIPFTVARTGDVVTFSFVNATNLLTIEVEGSTPAPDDNVAWDGVRHDSRDLLYRTPGGAVPAGTPVTLRLRTFHDDVTAVAARVYSLEAGGQQILPMTVAAAGVDCYQPDLEGNRCDFWEVSLPNDTPDNLWYRFIVTDGADTDYYDDDTAALDGGLGAVTDETQDRSWALMIHEPGFEAPAWAADAVIYQIFPDRFRNGRSNNDPRTGDRRYDDPVLALPWNTLPEGYCRNYGDAPETCPWRFDPTPPSSSPTIEQPRGRDYMGGDLKGVDQQLDRLAAMGVTAIYFNPIFDAGSNHSYDTQDYTRIDPYFGTQKDWENLVKHAERRGIRIILDGVFNHLSSDSPFFDRYGHYGAVGACESEDSPYRDWFFFREEANGPCAGPEGPNTMTYDAWFGFDSIPVLDKTNSAVQQYFLTDPNSITRRWLAAGAAGWRLDVSGDPSFPDGYWETFRNVVDDADPDALTISETWQKDSTLLRMIRGDRLDTTMNYRLRDAVLGLLAPQAFDAKGFADSGRQLLASEFAARLESVREDYPDAAYYSLMNLLDSHDTERLLWTVTPGAEAGGERERTANLAAGKANVRLAALIQFTMPGAPTVYYGDEVGVTGDDDPDDRRTYPWADKGGVPDETLRAHYTALAGARQTLPALTAGDFRVLATDDAAATVAYGRRTDSSAAVVVINAGASAATVAVPVAGYLPDGTTLGLLAPANTPASGAATVSGGALSIELPARSAVVLGADGIDLAPPSAPMNLTVTTEGDGEVGLEWTAVPGAAGYRVYASPVSGGGWIPVAEVSGTAHTVSDLENARRYHFVVTALDAAGNESERSSEVAAVPHLTIGWANLQWPPSMTHTISTTNRTDNVYGQVWIDGVTNQPGPAPSLRAQLGYGADESDPGGAGWSWVEASFNVDAGNNDEFVASLLPEETGPFDYAYRYSTDGGISWVYADLDGIGNGYSPDEAGVLTVNASGDTSPPPAPTGLTVVSASPSGVELRWDAVDDATLHGYEVGRALVSGEPYEVLATVSGTTTFTDTRVVTNETYVYVVRAVDTSFNRSDWSPDVTATAALRTVTLTFDVTVPATTDDTGQKVNIAGFLDRLDGGHPQWDPGGTPLSQVDPTHWTITFTGLEGTQIEYKYALGSWDHVEKDGACGETPNRQLTLTYGAGGVQTVNDIVPNWRNVAPCGN